MALRSVNRRFKSTSDIFDEAVSNEMSDGAQGNPKNRFSTYTFKDLQQERRKFVKKREPKKSQNFLRRLLASLDKKNEACKADDEFVTEYYRRNDYSNPNSDYLDATLQNFEETNESSRLLGARSFRTFTIDRCRPDLVSKRQSTNAADHREIRTFSSEDLKMIKNSADYAKSRRFRRNSNDLSRCTLERIFTNGKDEERIEPKNEKAKPSRKRSLIDFLGFMIRWRRSDEKEKPRCFVSCNRLVSQTNSFYSENVMQMSRTSSVDAIVPEKCEEPTIMQIGKQNARMRHIYNEKTHEQLVEVLTKNKENQQILPRNRSVEYFVKPSAIKDIAKRHQQLPENWQPDRRITARWK
ncbi:uncharacterized protein LOC117230113 [Megalopta genalis]|uniref:uncharacterized protein LOC117230113 n=1 Tax=Megalopta genalis TaxID=115081 RepID=UPI00144332CC|nr:uncharacterized protein LOC117230113 [Megalopta genalis]